MLDELGNNHNARLFMMAPNIYYAGHFIKGHTYYKKSISTKVKIQ